MPLERRDTPVMLAEIDTKVKVYIVSPRNQGVVSQELLLLLLLNLLQVGVMIQVLEI